MASKHLQQPSLEDAIEASGIDPADEPSVGWGWHGHANKTFKVLGLFFALFLLAMMIGDHESRIEDLYLGLFAAIIVFFIGANEYRARNKWNR